MNKQKRIEAEEIFSILSDTINGAKFDDLCDAVHMIVDIAGYRKQSGWISVEERLPDCIMDCLVHCVHSYCDYDGYSNITIRIFANGEFGIDKAYKVTHWMPLPEAPKMKGE